ncbi:hypothetical protein B0H17DRAFT_958033, partial [Mycena rosella]
MSLTAQKAAISKIIWQQVATVVILKQNMRQAATTPDNVKLRTALVNMRYGACTAADIQYLHSRTISRRPGHPTFNDPRFRYVSIITGLNLQKDKIDELGCIKYVKENNQDLTVFYSNDPPAGNGGSDERKPRSARNQNVQRLIKTLPKNRQQQLWDAPPSSTDNHMPGKLSLCVGMPVMIRNNDATELCVTKGQEGRVVGWQEGIGNSGQKIFDTLFVELVNPPRVIRIKGLPDNAVALSCATKKNWCSAPDGMLIQFNREQV